jgi:hypothetical protein
MVFFWPMDYTEAGGVAGMVGKMKAGFAASCTTAIYSIIRRLMKGCSQSPFVASPGMKG